MEKLSSLIACALILAIARNPIFTNAGDPDILKDFLVPPGLNESTITRQYFTFTNFRYFETKANLTGRTTAFIAKATKKEFPALEGQSVSMAKIIYPPSGINPPHTHPRSAELLIVLEGILEVGFVDTENRLFLQTLQANDLFIFPKGLVHFQVNTQPDCKAVALGVFGSASAGTVSIPASVFGSGIDREILAKAFHTDNQTISELVQANK
ncbi:hypothetical protein ACJRO7_019419 [Eucalyptus globulus]|uniref:Germin-like protein n=1 Tax=Eucalyptus globulus TaxID=34317 RepID=A0ABD3KLH6_EUCGL